MPHPHVVINDINIALLHLFKAAYRNPGVSVACVYSTDGWGRKRRVRGKETGKASHTIVHFCLVLSPPPAVTLTSPPLLCSPRVHPGGREPYTSSPFHITTKRSPSHLSNSLHACNWLRQTLAGWGWGFSILLCRIDSDKQTLRRMNAYQLPAQLSLAFSAQRQTLSPRTWLFYYFFPSFCSLPF